MLRRKLTVAAVAAATTLATALLAAPSASAATPHKAIPNTAPNWIAAAKHLGSASPSASVSARIYLAPRGGLDALKAQVLAVSTPGSASYHQFLSPAQYRAQYAPSAATVAAVKSYVTAAGLKVTGVEASDRYISVSGNVAAAQKAFGTSIQRFQHKGQTVQAPTSAVVLPTAVASAVLTVTGLDTSTHTMAPASKQQEPPPAGFRNARPCSIYFGQIAAKYQADYKTPLPKFNGKTLTYAPCGYTGTQFRAAYEGDSALRGTGVTVAITDAYASPTIASDASTYAINHGDGSYAKGQLTQTKLGAFRDSSSCGENGWWGEETLDVEAVHAMAPGANIRYYGARSCEDPDLLAALARVVDDNKAQLVTNSWGDVEENEGPDGVAAYEQVFLQGAMQGISFMFSSGDNGDELANTGVKQADYPTSDPYVTSVGGTSTAIDASGKLQAETGWGTVKYSLAADGKSWTPVGYLYGAGGGSSALFNKPAYQVGVTPGATRQVPDVALDADPQTGMLIGQTQQFSNGAYYDEYRIGGTSLASPLFAGMTALAAQKAGSRAGLLNPIVYANASNGTFMDVKGNPAQAGVVRVDYANTQDASGGLLYSVRTFNQDSSLKVTTGWDNVTGVGSPTAKWLSALG